MKFRGCAREPEANGISLLALRMCKNDHEGRGRERGQKRTQYEKTSYKVRREQQPGSAEKRKKNGRRNGQSESNDPNGRVWVEKDAGGKKRPRGRLLITRGKRISVRTLHSTAARSTQGTYFPHSHSNNKFAYGALHACPDGRMATGGIKKKQPLPAELFCRCVCVCVCARFMKGWESSRENPPTLIQLLAFQLLPCMSLLLQTAQTDTAQANKLNRGPKVSQWLSFIGKILTERLERGGGQQAMKRIAKRVHKRMK